MLTRKQIKEAVDNLRCDTAAVEPQDFTFEPEEYGKTWETIDPDLSSMSAEQLKQIASDHGIDLDDLTADPDDFEEWTTAAAEKLCEEMRDNDDFAPMMNYIYPIDGCNLSGPEIQARILGTSLVAVEVNGASFLALAGGGMDFSWEICEAYVLIGMCPPLHFRPEADCRDPDSDRVRLVVAGYLKSCEVMINRATSARRDIRHTVQRLREYQAERAVRDAEAAKQRAKAERKAARSVAP